MMVFADAVTTDLTIHPLLKNAGWKSKGFLSVVVARDESIWILAQKISPDISLPQGT
jgi:hypothetical protein